MKRVKLKDIALQMNIAPSTVSRALNNKPGVSEELREEIRQYASGIGYHTPKDVKRINYAKNSIIALIVGDIKNPFYVDFTAAFQKVVSRQGYTVTVFSTNYNYNEEIHCLELIKNMNFSGVVHVATTSPSAIGMLDPHVTPIVTIYNTDSSFFCDRILLDSHDAGYIAANYLIKLGHKDIGFLLGHLESITSIERFEGYKKAMSENSLVINDAIILQGDYSIESGYKTAKQMISNYSSLPSAMIISNDFSAYGFAMACSEAEVKIPEQMSIVSFDNIKISYSGSVSITTVDTRAEEKGTLAAEMILRRIRNPNKKTECIKLEPTLIARKSTAPLKK